MNFDVSFCNSCGGKMIKVAFYVLQQCSYVVQVWWKHDKSFIANFLLNPNLKTEDLPTCGKVMNERYLWSLSHSVD